MLGEATIERHVAAVHLAKLDDFPQKKGLRIIDAVALGFLDFKLFESGSLAMQWYAIMYRQHRRSVFQMHKNQSALSDCKDLERSYFVSFLRLH